MRFSSFCLIFSVVLGAGDVLAHEEMTIYGHQHKLLGDALSASEGYVGSGEILSRPTLRTGEIMEFVPGMVVTQHSGSGKANQYFLRGFNLDHGTDFQTSVEGMPVNMRSHGHGQGYSDINFVIPELVEGIYYRKGPYYAANGDFSTAGSAAFKMKQTLDAPLASVELGEYAYLRALGAGDFSLGDGRLLMALESQQYDGPWQDIQEDIRKYNGLARYSSQVMGGDFTLSFMAYENSWRSADQIPQRVVQQGLLSRLGSLDTTVGGESSRYSLSSTWQGEQWEWNAYVLSSRLDLLSNFTYFLEQPEEGDQFRQLDERRVWGGSLQRSWNLQLGEKSLLSTAGVEVRYDDIPRLGLEWASRGISTSVIRKDAVRELSSALYGELEFLLDPHLMLRAGLRYDYFSAEVSSRQPENSGKAHDGLMSLKLGMSYLFNASLEAYFNLGQSYHSNDARGATITLDPLSGQAVEKVDLLVPGQGVEAGVRFHDGENWNLSLALWLLDLDSELLFVGDAGNTEASRASRRHGVELAGYFWLAERLSADLEVAWTRSRYRDLRRQEGGHIEGSLPLVVSAGFTWIPAEDWESTLRIRHFGRRKLDSFGLVQGDDFLVTNMNLTYNSDTWNYRLSLLNLFNSQDKDIEYLYTSRLQGEVLGGIEDRHFHPIEPRSLRFRIQSRF